MMKTCRTLLTAFAFTAIATQASFALHRKPAPTPPSSVPEINPALATGALALIAGSVLILRRGRLTA